MRAGCPCSRWHHWLAAETAPRQHHRRSWARKTHRLACALNGTRSAARTDVTSLNDRARRWAPPYPTGAVNRATLRPPFLGAEILRERYGSHSTACRSSPPQRLLAAKQIHLKRYQFLPTSTSNFPREVFSPNLPTTPVHRLSLTMGAVSLLASNMLELASWAPRSCVTLLTRREQSATILCHKRTLHEEHWQAYNRTHQALLPGTWFQEARHESPLCPPLPSCPLPVVDRPAHASGLPSHLRSNLLRRMMLVSGRRATCTGKKKRAKEKVRETPQEIQVPAKNWYHPAVPDVLVPCSSSCVVSVETSENSKLNYGEYAPTPAS